MAAVKLSPNLPGSFLFSFSAVEKKWLEAAVKLSMACLVQAPAVQLAEHAKAILEDDAKLGLCRRDPALERLARGKSTRHSAPWQMFFSLARHLVFDLKPCIEPFTSNNLQPRQRKLSALLLQKACGRH